MRNADLKTRLEPYFEEVTKVILSRQHPVTGLLPASTAVNSHGDYRDAWVRDNVYSILAVWGLALAYRKLDDDDGKSFELEHAVIKLMRGLLFAMMQQADKVEAFKHSLHPLDALHAKYSTATGDTVVTDDGWGHLQLDATSLYLLCLAQMTASGMTLIYSLDEVDFIQNLVFYIGRSYRTADYGIWERGDKTNHGEPELNASSVAMAKAALEAMSGLNLFGVAGSQASVIHVLPDDIARSRTTLETLLPRESSSKETDAALLSAIGFPAFAVEDPELRQRTHQALITKLEGPYGLKRFLRDGHQTVLEDPHRLHYEPEELKQFEHIESEWPLFFAYLSLDHFFSGNDTEAGIYLQKLERVLVWQHGFALVPELYFVAGPDIQAERGQPGSQPRLPNANVPLVWAQSLYLLARLLRDRLINIRDLDPLGRHRQHTLLKPIVQIALIAEDSALQSKLRSYGVETETMTDLSPAKLIMVENLGQLYHHLGENHKLSLTGRPLQWLLSLSTSQLFHLSGELLLCPPAFLDKHAFYLSHDPAFLVTRFKSELEYIHRHWSSAGRPTIAMLLSQEMLDHEDILLELLYDLRSGSCSGVPVSVAPLHLLARRASHQTLQLRKVQMNPVSKTSRQPARLQPHQQACKLLSQDEELQIELEINPDVLIQRLATSENLHEMIVLLETLTHIFGQEGQVALGRLEDLLEEVYNTAAKWRIWAVVRRAAGLLGKVDGAISESVTDILVSQKSILIGKAYSERSLIVRPLSETELSAKIAEFCREDSGDRVLTQELLIYLGLLIRAEPALFKDLLTVRVGYLIVLLAADLAQELGVTQDEGYACLLHLPPSEIQQRLREVLASFTQKQDLLKEQETLAAYGLDNLDWSVEDNRSDASITDWWNWRKREGTVSRIPAGFYSGIWSLLERCEGVIIGDKLDRRNRLHSRLLLEMTSGEKNFAMRVEHLLNKIASPEYRQLTIEALGVLHRVIARNAHLAIKSYLVLDVIIGHAVRLAYLDSFPERLSEYEANKAHAWATFYSRSPSETMRYVVRSFQFLLEVGLDRELV